MRRALWLVGLLLLAAACTREPGISPGDGNSDPAGASRNPVMSMERLQELALELPDDFSDGLSTRSGRKMIREVVSVTDFIDGSLLEPFAASVAASGTKAAATRAGGVDPADASPGSLSAEADVAATLGRIYVVNYEDDAGFAILSADRQLPSVLGYADSGNITDTMTNPGIKLFLERMADFVATSLRWDSLTDPDPPVNPPVDPDPGGGGGTGPSPDPSDTTVVYHRMHQGFQRILTKGPFVQVEWGQGAPFNKKTPACDPPQMNAPAGCVAIAILQIMSYHHYPTSYATGVFDRSELDWNAFNACKRYVNLNSDPLLAARMADFVRRIGDNVDMSYHCDKSSASIQAAKRALKNYGFHTDDICSYSLERVRAEIDANHPLFISGYPTSGGDGHAWVIDGYVHGYYPTEVFMDVYDSNGNLLRGYYLGIENEYHDFVHCNWGWDGNGYFLHTWLFPKSPEIPDAGTGHAHVSIRPYTNDLKIIKGIWR